MKKFELSNFNTVGDLVDYFDNNFALTTWANKSFLEYHDQKGAQTWIRLFISLIDEENLEIVEYDYIFDNLLDDESKSKDPLWGKVQPYFHGKGNYITPLRMNVVHFIAASERFFDADKCKVEVVAKNLLLFAEARTLVIMGGMSLNEMISLFNWSHEDIDTYLFFPYPQNVYPKDFGILNMEHFFSIKLSQEGFKKCRKIQDDEMNEAIEKLDAYFSKTSDN